LSHGAVFIVNPQAGGGRTAARLDSLRRMVEHLFPSGQVVVTRGPGHASELAASATDAGATMVIAVGGDGTASEVVNGFLLDGAPRRGRLPEFSVIPAGTGGDLARYLGISADWEVSLPWLAGSVARDADLYVATVATPDGSRRVRAGVNVLGFGMAGEVVRRVNAGSKLIGGAWPFLSATVRSLMTYRPPLVTVRWGGPNGEGEATLPLMNGFLANGSYCGGGMWVGEGGRIDDGLLDLTLVPELPLNRSLPGLVKLYRGGLDGERDFVRARVAWIEASSSSGAPVLVDVDGESPGQLPLRVEVLANVLPIHGRW
jgi:diacylglycerol kinase (ATP)